MLRQRFVLASVIAATLAKMMIMPTMSAVVTARIGDVIPPAGDKRPTGAMVIATGASPEEAKANAGAALARIDIRTE